MSLGRGRGRGRGQGGRAGWDERMRWGERDQQQCVAPRSLTLVGDELGGGIGWWLSSRLPM